MTKRPLDPGDFSKEEARFARRLRTARRAADLTHGRLAEISGVGKSYISAVENLHANPSLLTCMRLSAAIGVDLGDLTTSRWVRELDPPEEK